jgi:CheY-specific phosphatase CheX
MIPAKQPQASKPDLAQRARWTPVLELAVREVFEIMLGSKLKPCTGEGDAHSFDVTAMVGLAGGMCGVLTFRCGFPAAARIASKMLATEVRDSDEQAGDAVGEVCNKRPDLFRRQLETAGDRALLQQPAVPRLPVSGALRVLVRH